MSRILRYLKERRTSFFYVPIIILVLSTIVFGINGTLNETVSNFTGTITTSIEELATTIDEPNITTPAEEVSTTIEEQTTTLEEVALSDKISREIKENIENNPKGKIKVLVQLKNKDENLENKIKAKGKIDKSLDDNLIIAELTANSINEIVDDNVVKVWTDRKTFLVLDSSTEQIKAQFMWNSGYTGRNVKIAILDTGVYNHSMLQGRIIASRDFTGGDDSNDYYGHGTHVAGIAAGSNLTGKYNGVAPEASIMNGKVLDDNGYGQLSWLINGIIWAIDPDNNPNTDDGADVISLSLGAAYDADPEELLDSPEIIKIKEAVSRGVTVVVASGNCGNGCNGFYGVTTPGISPDAITVGAVDDNNLHASFSSGDAISNYIKPDLVAPGVNICSSVPDGYGCFSGTSMSTPHVSGAVSLLLQKSPDLSPAEVKAILEQGSLELGDNGKDTEYGSGLIDLSKLNQNVSIPIELGKNYSLIIPAFEIDRESKILLYFNNTEKDRGKQNNKITVIFDLEELDYDLKKEITKTVPAGKIGVFEYSFKPSVIGKHLLVIEVYSQNQLVEHINAVVAVGGTFEVNIAKVEVVDRGDLKSGGKS